MKYDTTNPEAIKHEMREKTAKQLRSIREKNAPGTTAHFLYGDRAIARHRAAYFEIRSRQKNFPLPASDIRLR